MVIDGKDHLAGFSGFSNLPDLLAADPKAKALAEEYTKYALWGNVLIFGGLGAAVGYSLAKDSDEYSSGTYWTIFFAGFLPGIMVSGYAGIKLVRALNQYNGVYSQQEVSAQNKHWMWSPTPNGLAVAYSF